MGVLITTPEETGRDLLTQPPSQDELVFLLPDGVPLPRGNGELPALMMHPGHLVSVRPFDKHRDYVSLHGRIMQEAIHSHGWTAAKRHWQPYWETSGWIRGKQSIGRRWNSEFRNGPCSRFIVECPRFAARLRGMNQKTQDVYGPTEQQLMRDFARTNTTIEDIAAHLTNLPDKPRMVSRFHREACQEDAIYRIHWQDFGEITRDAFGNRMHSFYSNCPREVRKTLVVDGRFHVVELDLSNSQPYFLAVVFSSIRQLVEAATAGRFYETVNIHLDCPLDMSDKPQRDRLKETCLMLIYRRPRNGCIWWELKDKWHGQVMTAMEKAYPGIDAALSAYALTHGSDTALVSTLQRMESTVFIDRILPECQRLGLWVAPIHDCMLCLEHEQDAVWAIMQRELLAFTGIPPNIKSK